MWGLKFENIFPKKLACQYVKSDYVFVTFCKKAELVCPQTLKFQEKLAYRY